jgi:hypothetical protein
MSDKLLWWGYRHTNGDVQAKRYWDDPGDLREAAQSDFVQQVVQPFEAASRDEALKIIRQRTPT